MVSEAIEKFRNAGSNGGGKAKTAEEIRAEIAALEKALAAAEEGERKAAMAGNAKRATALLAAMRAAYAEIEKLFEGTFGDEKFQPLATSQAWPRDTKFKRAADLSETEIENAREAGRKAIDTLREPIK